MQDTKHYWDERIMARKDGSLFWVRVRGHTFTPDNPLQRGIWSVSDLSEVRPYQELTRREREIVPYIVDGLTSKEIARKLDLSHRTVEVYRSNLLKKFGVANSNVLAQALGDINAQHIVDHKK